VVLAFTRRQFVQWLLEAPPARALLEEPTHRQMLAPHLLRVAVPVRGLDRRLDGLRVGLLSDVHVGITLGVDHLARAVDLLRANPPEILAVTGDLVDDPAFAPACFATLARAPAPHGRFFVMGNHDNWGGREETLAAARGQPGVTTLVGQEVDLRVQGARLHVCGIDYPPHATRWNLGAAVDPALVAQATRHVAEADFRLALVHHPANFDAVADRGVEVTLAGHTHGGQVRGVGTWVTALTFPYVHGLYPRGDRRLYVSGGTGHWWPTRIGIPAEVTLLTLVRV
jgi:hypothetical protein